MVQLWCNFGPVLRAGLWLCLGGECLGALAKIHLETMGSFSSSSSYTHQNHLFLVHIVNYIALHFYPLNSKTLNCSVV